MFLADARQVKSAVNLHAQVCVSSAGELVIDLFVGEKYTSSSVPSEKSRPVLGRGAVLHRSPLWLPVPFVTAAGIAHSH